MKNLAFIFLLAVIVGLPCAAQAQSPQQTLDQYVADLQKNPDDFALRAKIIKRAQTMRPVPAVPDEASKFMDRGIAAIEGAKTEEDFRAASGEFSKAVHLAPWLGDAYRNLAIALDKSGQYDAALKNLRLYLLSSPSPADEAWAKSLINKVEYRKEKAAKEPSRQAAAAPKQNTFEDLLRKIDGRRYTYPIEACSMVIDVTGKVFRVGNLCPQNHDVPSFRGYLEGVRDEIRGRETTVTVYDRPAGPLKVWTVSRTYVISDDGDRITYRVGYNDGDVRQYILLWQR